MNQTTFNLTIIPIIPDFPIIFSEDNQQYIDYALILLFVAAVVMNLLPLLARVGGIET